MCDSSCLKTPFKIQPVHGSQTLLKPARQTLFAKFSIDVRQMDLEKISLSQIWNHITVF